MSRTTKYFIGIILTLLIATLANYLSNIVYFKKLGLSSIVIAMVIGLFIGNSVYVRYDKYCQVGVQFCKGPILRLSIILFGIKLTLQDIALVGYQGIIIDVLIVITTFFLTMFMATKLFRLDRNSAILIGSGCSICGAAAVIATESTIKAPAEKVTMAVAIVVVFGTIAMFIYPAIYSYIVTFGSVSDTEFGIYIGSTIHEVGQVVAAGNSINETAGESAIISKMIRVLLLAPFLLILSAYLVKQENLTHNNHKRKIIIPWFAIGFLLMACINSLHFLADEFINIIKSIDDILLTMAMSALGLTSHYSAFQKAGVKPLILGLIIFIWLIIGGAAINFLVNFCFY